ncbi:MAG: hypothetical protein Q4C33_00810 [bacterium]|nr:hypothetical protein [bacterium]
MKNRIGVLVLLIIFVLIGYTGSIVFGEEKYYEAQWDQGSNLMAVIGTTVTTRDPFDPIFPKSNLYNASVTCDNGATASTVWDASLSKYVLSVSGVNAGGKCNVKFIAKTTATIKTGSTVTVPTVKTTISLS